MTQEGFKRKLTSVFSADAVGYSRLMGDDEAATVRTLTSYRDVISTLIKQHNGIVIDSPGDNLLAEFVSVVDAVQCAVAVQKELKARNEDLPENRMMQFRIGINLGDVIQEDDRIYGDGVNIAARLEGLAEPGGICISKTAFDHIESKLPYGYDFIGDQSVKNIAKPVGAYRVLLDPRVTVSGKPVDEKNKATRRMPILVGAVIVLVLAVAVGSWYLLTMRPNQPPIETASIEKMAYPLPDKPSIAVLPFDNLSRDPDHEYIADGISENITSVLSMITELFVIDRNSTSVYKGKAIKVQHVAEDLGVRYVLEGSVQKSKDNIRVTAQLIDALNGYHLWSERYDRKLKDIFSIQDDISMSVLVAIQVKLTEGEQALIQVRDTNNLKAYEKQHQAMSLIRSGNPVDNLKAQKLFKEVIAMDPNYTGAYRWLGVSHLMDIWLGLSKNKTKSIGLAFEYCQKALSLDENNSGNLLLLGMIHLLKGEYNKAIDSCNRALALNPNFADAYAVLGIIFNHMGKYEDTVNVSNKAVRLNPFPPDHYIIDLAVAYRNIGQYEKAIEGSKKVLDRNPNNFFAWDNLVHFYIALGKEKKARKAGMEMLRLNPGFSTNQYINSQVWEALKNPAVKKRVIEIYRKAGLPE